MNTRLKTLNLGAQAVDGLGGGTVQWDIPKTGILAALLLVITGNITTAISTPNALGKANLISRVRLIANAGINLIDVSGVGYHYLLRDFVEHYVDPVPQSDGRAAQATGAFDLSMFFPIAMNDRDPVGLIMLQNEETLLRLEVQRGPSTDLGNDITVLTCSIQPFIDVFTVPQNPKDWPPFDFAHTMQEESQAVAGAGAVTWYWPRGNIYSQVIHGLGIGAAGADGFTNAQLRLNQSDYLVDAPPAYFTRAFSRTRGRTRLGGVLPIFDGLGSSGLGNYGSGRDLMDSRLLTDISSVITASGAGTLRTMKRQLVPLPKSAG
jgi:hypothetical protein